VIEPAHEFDDRERADDIAFINELREASAVRLRQIRRRLAMGAPMWRLVALSRAEDKVDGRRTSTDH
jgi:hypothetical protein